MVTNIEWTEENVAELKRLWESDHSQGQIARILGVTRSAIAGKVSRLGLSASDARKSRRFDIPKDRPGVSIPRPKPKPVVAIKRQAPQPIPKSLPIGNTEPIGVMETDETTCKWPVDTEEGMKYCGLPSLGVRPYCPHHNDKAYVPNTKRVR